MKNNLQDIPKEAIETAANCTWGVVESGLRSGESKSVDKITKADMSDCPAWWPYVKALRALKAARLWNQPRDGK